MTHICVSDLTNIGSDNGLSPARRQAIIWANAGILLIEPLGTNFSEILIGMQIFSWSSSKWRPFCLGLNELIIVMVSSCPIRGTAFFMSNTRWTTQLFMVKLGWSSCTWRSYFPHTWWITRCFLPALIYICIYIGSLTLIYLNVHKIHGINTQH